MATEEAWKCICGWIIHHSGKCENCGTEKKVSKHLRFKIEESKPKTKVYTIFSKNDLTVLGRIFWYGGWRQYIFQPESNNTIWSEDCLKDLQLFMEGLKAQRVQEKKRGE